MLVETNGTNNVKYQIDGQSVRLDALPSTAPSLDTADNVSTSYNDDNTVCTTYSFKKTIRDTYNNRDVNIEDFIEHVDNLKLKRYKRQSNIFVFPDAKQLILGKETEDRSFAATFKSDKGKMSYSVGNPKINFTDNLLTLSDDVDIEDLYVSYWKYVGLTASREYIEDVAPLNTLKYLNIEINPSTAVTTLDLRAVTDTTYILPDNNEDLDYSNVYIVTSTKINQILNSIGDLDQGTYW